MEYMNLKIVYKLFIYLQNIVPFCIYTSISVTVFYFANNWIIDLFNFS